MKSSRLLILFPKSWIAWGIDILDTGDSGEIENFVFVMVDKIPKYKEMGYQVVAD